MIARTQKKIKRVAFFGDATAKKTDEHYIQAFEVAKFLAENGYVVVNGGGPGVMQAASLGARAGGGRVEVVVLNPKYEPKNYEGINQMNVEVADKKYVTKNYKDRLDKLIEIADAFITFKGGAGTLSEVGMTWELAKFNYGHHEPLIFYGNCWKDIVEDLIKDLQMEKIEQNVVDTANSPEEVLEILSRANGKKVKVKSWWERVTNLVKF